MTRIILRILCVLTLALAAHGRAPARAANTPDMMQRCASGTIAACRQVATAAETQKNLSLYEKAADTGCQLRDPQSCGNLGFLHITGKASQSNISYGGELIYYGCKGGDGRSCTNLGWMYYGGNGVAQDTAMAAQYYRHGCVADSAAGCRNLALLMLKKEIKGSKMKARSLLRKACRKGDSQACKWMAR